MLRRGTLENKTDLRNKFIANLLAITGDTRVLWTPKPTDTTTCLDESLNGRTLTAEATIASQIIAQGNGYGRTFDGSANKFTAPDAANLTFVSGGADQAFSIFVLAKITDTANTRSLLCKLNEYHLRITTADKLIFFISNSAGTVQPFKLSDNAITQGAFGLFCATYTGAGGATAANGMLIYENGVAIAQTAGNDVAYTTMSDTTNVLEIGSQNAANFLQGSALLAGTSLGVLTPSQIWAMKKLINSHFGLSL